jgi:hypothetical protein
MLLHSQVAPAAWPVVAAGAAKWYWEVQREQAAAGQLYVQHAADRTGGSCRAAVVAGRAAGRCRAAVSAAMAAGCRRAAAVTGADRAPHLFWAKGLAG